MRSEKREKKPAPSLQRQQKQQLFERKKKPGREERKRAEKGDNAQVSLGVKRAGTGDLGGTSYKRNCHWERCGSGGSRAPRLGSRAQLAGGCCPVGGTDWGHRPGDRERLAKWHRVSEPLGSRRHGGKTGCPLALWRLPILRPWPALLWTLPISGDPPQKTGKGRRRRRRQLNEPLQWEV